MVSRIARNYRFLLRGSRASEREIARRCGASRRSLIRLRKIPYDAEESVTFRTLRHVESTFELPEGWMLMTPNVRLGLGVEGGPRVPAETVEGIRDQFPDWSFREGSKVLILLAQNTPLSAAKDLAIG